MTTPRLLIIGGTGFIGHHLLKSVKQKGWEVTSVSLKPPTEQRFVDGVRYMHLNLADRKPVKKYLNEEYDYVVNLGGYINHQLFQKGGGSLIDTHFSSLQNLLEVLPRQRLKRFVQIGSSDEYGNSPAPQEETLRENPISPYSLAKVASTFFLQMLHRTENFPSVTLRLFITYGPGQDVDRFLPQIIRGSLDASSFSASTGEQIRDFCYVGDTVQAILQALVTPEINGEVFNVASGKPVSIRTIIEKVCSLIGSGKPQYGEVPYRPGENMVLFANISKAKSILQWEPVISLEKGLKQTIEYFANDSV